MTKAEANSARSVEISVITPVFNAERYIEAAVLSVRRQTRGDFEHIVVDDGSTDKTGALLDRLASEDGRLRIVHQDRGGVTAARNRGCLLARGRFVGFLDGDDLWEPEFLEVLAGYLERQPESVKGVFCSAQLIGPDGENLRPARARSGIFDLAGFLAEGSSGNGSCLLFRSSPFAGKQPFKQALDEDTTLWLEILAESPQATLHSLPRALIRYRKHPGSLTSNFWAAGRLAAFDLHFEKYMNAVPRHRRAIIYDAAIRRMVRQASAAEAGFLSKWARRSLKEISFHSFLRPEALVLNLLIVLCGISAVRKLVESLHALRGKILTARRG